MVFLKGICSSRTNWIENKGQGQICEIQRTGEIEYPPPIGHFPKKLRSLTKAILPKPRVYSLPNGILIDREGAEGNKDGILFLDTVQRFAVPVAQSVLFRPTQKRCLKIDGNVASCLSHGSYNLCHFLLDLLPKVWLIRQSEFQVDYWAVPSQLPKWATALLSLVGIDRENMIQFSDLEYIEASTLISADASGACTWPAAWVKEALNDLLLDGLPCYSERKIWISRYGQKHRPWRNEQAAWPQLEELGFEVHLMEDMSIKQQIELASSSSVVAGPHGAGLVWAVLSKNKSGLLVELVGNDIVHNTFRAVAGLAGWDYYRTSFGNETSGETNNVFGEITQSVDEAMSEICQAMEIWTSRRSGRS